MNAPRGTLRYWPNLTALTLIALVARYFAYTYRGVSCFKAKEFTHPQRMLVCCTTPADKGYDYEDVTLNPNDGILI